MAPFSDEYLFVEIANKVCLRLQIVHVSNDFHLLLSFLLKPFAPFKLLCRLYFGSNQTTMGLI